MAWQEDLPFPFFGSGLASVDEHWGFTRYYNSQIRSGHANGVQHITVVRVTDVRISVSGITVWIISDDADRMHQKVDHHILLRHNTERNKEALKDYFDKKLIKKDGRIMLTTISKGLQYFICCFFSMDPVKKTPPVPMH
jgi:hypothetical protein